MQNRGWSFFSFSFWDVNKDGILTSEDIFARFKEIQLGDLEAPPKSMAIPVVKEASELLVNQMKSLNASFPKKSYQERADNPEEGEDIKYLE